MPAIRLFKDREDGLIRFEDLKKIPKYKYIDIFDEKPGSIVTMRIDSNNDNLSFRVIMEPGNVWHPHHHDCEETILIYKGVLINKNNNKKASRGVIMEFKPYETHYVESETYCEFYVEFKKPD